MVILCSRARVQVDRLFPRAKNYREIIYRTQGDHMAPRPRPGESTLSARKKFYGKFIQKIVISCVPAPASRCINSFRVKKNLVQIWAVSMLFLCVFRSIYVNQLFQREKKMNTKTLKNNKKRTINLICLYICIDISFLLNV